MADNEKLTRLVRRRDGDQDEAAGTVVEIGAGMPLPDDVERERSPEELARMSAEGAGLVAAELVWREAGVIQPIPSETRRPTGMVGRDAQRETAISEFLEEHGDG